MAAPSWADDGVSLGSAQFGKGGDGTAELDGDQGEVLLGGEVVKDVGEFIDGRDERELKMAVSERFAQFLKSGCRADERADELAVVSASSREVDAHRFVHRRIARWKQRGIV